MKGAKYLFIFIFTSYFLLFIGLYTAQGFGYYDFESSKKKTLTANAMKKFDEDIKRGRKIDVKNYIEEEKNYNNNLSRASLALSNIIEKSFDELMNKMFNEVYNVTKD